MVARSFAAAGAALVSLWVTAQLTDGSFRALVQGWYQPLLVATAVGLALLAALAALPALRTRERWRVRLTPASALAVVAVAVPVVAGLVFTPGALGSRSLDLDRASALDTLRFDVADLQPDPAQRNVFQWAYALEYEDRAALVGQAVDVIAFVYRPEGTPPDRFQAARFVVACCVADATGYALPVRWPAAADLTDDSWVRVEGAVATGPDGALIIDAAAVTPVDPPSSPYIYP